jgi:porin
MKKGLPGKYMWRRALICAGGVFAFLSANSVLATPPMVVALDNSDTTTGTNQTSSGSFLSGLKRSSTLLGDTGGVRPFLSKYGMSLSILETSEVLGNVTGGSKEGVDYDGLTQMVLQLDTQRAFGLYGGTFNVSGLQIHGKNESADYLNTLQTASGIEADRSLRLWELWYQQKFLDEDRLDIKIGQQSLDQEFMVSQNGLLFVNTMFGWPMLPSADLPGGGPAYPLSAPGIRFRWRPINSLTFLAGVFNGSPVADNNGDPQMQNPSGASFPLNGGALAIAEVQYSFPSVGTMIYDSKSEPLSRTYKLGVWYDTENFGDQRYDNTGLSLADLGTSGIARTHRGDYALYAVADQMIWRDPGDPDGDRAIDFFTRVMGSPEEDRNLIDFSLNAGFTFHEPFIHRDDDTLGLAMGYAKVSGYAAGLDHDTQFFGGGFTLARSGETFIEATYQYQLTPWCQLQPDIQYVFNPGAGVANPLAPTERVQNEFVIGLRMNVLF